MKGTVGLPSWVATNPFPTAIPVREPSVGTLYFFRSRQIAIVACASRAAIGDDSGPFRKASDVFRII